MRISCQHQRVVVTAGAAGIGHAFVNNAGIAGPTAPVEAIEIADWDRTIAVDLNGMFYCTRRAVPPIKAAGGGSIINLSSIAGRLGLFLATPAGASISGQAISVCGNAEYMR